MKKYFDGFRGVDYLDYDSKVRFSNVFAHLILNETKLDEFPEWFAKRAFSVFRLEGNVENFYTDYLSSRNAKILFLNICLDIRPSGEWEDVQRTLQAWVYDEQLVLKVQ